MSKAAQKATEVEITECKGHPTITIWELEESGERSKYPLISFGKKKAQAILQNLEKIKELAG